MGDNMTVMSGPSANPEELPLTSAPQPALALTQPIFIFGIMQRSGTNYLWDMLRLHPDVAIRMPIVEDHLLQRSHHLVNYVEHVSRGWRDERLPAFEPEFLARSLGDGVISYLQSPFPDRPVVTKTPSVENLANFRRLFPDAKAVIIVRDGRSLVESGVKSFDWTYESSMQRWAAAARNILDFDAANKAAGQHLIVRYEDVLADMPGQLTAIMTFLGLDPARFDFERAANLPVRGSSTLRTEAGSGEVHWVPQAKPKDFDPTRRFEHWDSFKHARFNEVAGTYQRALGYECDDGARGPITALRQRAGDIGWWARRMRRRALAVRDAARTPLA